MRREDGARIWRPLARRTWAPDPEPSSRRKDKCEPAADAIIVSGRETRAEPDAARFALVREAVDAPLLVGSGLTEANAASFAAADGAIAGTSVKRDGRVDAARVARLAAAFRSCGGR
ncbi:MAG: BtpA/SgcQ family protein [Acidobacteriota bacterium]